jgi:outer membrane lipoprotein-sorting protein
LKIYLVLPSLILILLITSFNGCVPSQPTEELELLPSERLINRLEVNRRKIRNMEGTGTISVRTPQLDNNATFRVILQKPDSLQLTILGPFGIELADAVVTSDEFIFYDALQNTAYTGDSDNDALENIFRIDLNFSDIMDAFVGSVNLSENLYKAPDLYEIEYDKYVLTYFDTERNVIKRYKVDVRQLGITDFELTSFEGEPLLQGKYSRFEIIENVAVPYRIEVSNRKQNQKINIEYKKITANRNSISLDFSLPEDATIIRW